GILASVFLHHAHRAFTYFRGIFVRLGFLHHGSILSGKGASSKPGAVQADTETLMKLVQTVESHCPVLDSLVRAIEVKGRVTINGKLMQAEAEAEAQAAAA
ncbi:MAG TPA: hypothetical protein VIN38_11125, partial [Thiobacillus sp.]